MSADIEDLRLELAATQFWLRALYCMVSPNYSAAAVRKAIVEAKNYAPVDGGEAYDNLTIQMAPHVERIGEWIAASLDMQPGQVPLD